MVTLDNFPKFEPKGQGTTFVLTPPWPRKCAKKQFNT